MSVIVCLPLFGNPGQELEEGSAVRGRQLRDLSTELTERLQKAADALDKLEAAGWTARMAMYDVILHLGDVGTKEEAERRLRAAGIDPEELMIVEDVEEEEDEVA
jgi:hypothetical protein